MAKAEVSASLTEIVIKAQRAGLTLRPIGQRGAVFYLPGGGTYYAESLEQAEAFVDTVARALELRAERPVLWAGITQRAERERFDWDTAARHYIEQVYEPDRI